MKRMSQYIVVLSALLTIAYLPAPAQQSASKKIEKTVEKTASTARKTAKKVVGQTRKTAKKTAKTAATFVNKLATTPPWPTLLAAYDYDNNVPPEVSEEPVEHEAYTRINLSFAGGSGKPVTGVFMRPKEGEKFPCVLALHGLTQSKEIAVKDFGERLVENGVAVLALDAPRHGQDRKATQQSYWRAKVIRVAIHDGVLNYRSALDYLATRPDVDQDRIGLIGLSMGAMTGAILGGVEGRIKAFALCVGGDPFVPIARVVSASMGREEYFAVSPSLYIGHISPRPVLMINGRKDPIVVAPAALLLHEAAQMPKEVVWYNGDHDVPAAMKQKAVEWLVAKFTTESPEGTAPPSSP